MKKIKSLLKQYSENEVVQDVKKKLKPLTTSIQSKSNEIYNSGALTISEFSQFLGSTDWMKSLNYISNDVSRSMDKGFLIKEYNLQDVIKINPSNHRILDNGHGFFQSIAKAREIGEQKGLSDLDTFTQWWEAYFSDLSSAGGMPAFESATDDIYLFLRNTLNIDESTARDLVTINGQEAVDALLGSTLTVVVFMFSWKKQDKENFSKLVGSMGVGAVISMNPVLLSVVIVAAAIGYNTLVCKKSIQRGGIINIAAISTSALIPGPFLIGFLPALIVAFYLNKQMSKECDPSEIMKELIVRMSDKNEIKKLMESLEDKIKIKKSVA